jgi:H/ACA ribonucleoprotein complex subunit 4
LKHKIDTLAQEYPNSFNIQRSLLHQTVKSEVNSNELKPPWEVSRKLLVKAEEETDHKFGFKPDERPIQEYIKLGVINLDKPSGPSSHEVTAWLKRLINLNRAGHGGTLDPRVTGILPITLEEATKVVQALQVSGKQYTCVMKLHSSAPEQEIRKIMSEFTGVIYQRPPVRSSVKRRLRTRKIYYMNLLEMDNRNVLFEVGCEAGTYIRKLCYDMGEALGVSAHMQELRRTRAGPFTESKNMVTLHDIAYFQAKWQETKDEAVIRKFVQPMERVLDLLPKIVIRDSAVDAVCHGANLAAPGILALDSNIRTEDIVAVMTQKGEGVALVKAMVPTEAMFKMDHGIIAKTKRVLMRRNLYPKEWSTKRRIQKTKE